MLQYLDLVKHVLETGSRKENRTGVDTLSTFGHYYEHDMRNGFPLLTTKEISWKNIVIEMLWFLSGQTDISILKRHGCKFWDAWADPDTGKVPSAYGNFWRHFPTHVEEYGDTPGQPGYGRPATVPGHNDQLAWVLAELRKNPMSRRMVVSAWAPGNAQTSKLPPCHCLFMFNVQLEDKFDKLILDHNASLGIGGGSNVSRATRDELMRQYLYQRGLEGRHKLLASMKNPLTERGQPEQYGELKDALENPQQVQKLCLHLTQRSCDVALGVPYNLASYALLLQLFSQFSGIEPGTFGHTLVDAHVYTSKPDGSKAEFDHIPGLQTQLTREPRSLPRLKIDPSIKDLADIKRLMDPAVTTDEIMQLFKLEGYDPHPAIPFKVAV